jgi:SnoaL-like domain
MSTAAPYPTTTETEDRLAILDLIGRLGLLVDARDWSALEQLFADPVYSDRTSLFGGEPQTNTLTELVGGLLSAEKDARWLADRRDHVYPAGGEWQRAHLDARDCLTVSLRA